MSHQNPEVQSWVEVSNERNFAEGMWSTEIKRNFVKFNHILKYFFVLKMGMNEMFSKQADLSGLLNSTQPLYVDYVIHQATIEINEYYTEATAASGEIIL